MNSEEIVKLSACFKYDLKLQHYKQYEGIHLELKLGNVLPHMFATYL